MCVEIHQVQCAQSWIGPLSMEVSRQRKLEIHSSSCQMTHGEVVKSTRLMTRVEETSNQNTGLPTSNPHKHKSIHNRLLRDHCT